MMLSITSSLRRLSLVKPLTQQSLRFNSRYTKPALPQRLVQEFVPELNEKRIIPVHNTYYAENPYHEANMKELNDLLRKYITLPVVTEKVGRWITFEQYQGLAGKERLRPGEHRALTGVLARLNRIDTQLIPDDVQAVLDKYSRAKTKEEEQKIVRELDSEGRSRTIGRRKNASALVYMARGTGEIIVNGVSMNKFFRRLQEREDILYPLKVVEGEGEYNIFATVEGGGFSGKSGAIVNGIAKGLIIHNPLLKPRLYKAGCMTRDHRVKERKKPGKRKARKSPTWVKR